MASVDDIFKNVGVPSKRKLEAIKDPNEIYKSSRFSTNGSGSRRAHAADAADDDDEEEEAGPARPPREHGDGGGGDDDDEEGRFFGGGITAKESEVLDYVQGADDANEGRAKINAGWMRKTAQSLERRMAKNAELRAKHEGEPQKFIGSEADLDVEIKSLSILSDHAELYPDFVQLGCASVLAGLLAHENTDIAIDAIEILGELTDEDVAATDDQWNTLVDALIDADLVGLLVSNLGRLNEDDETDRNGVYYALGILENLCSRPVTAARIGQDDGLLGWLLQRIRRKERSVSQNRQYAAEVLAILCQSTAETRQRVVGLGAVDALLQLVAPYRKVDPDASSDEEEYMEDLFEALTCLVDEPAGKAHFVEAEGVELCLIMLREGKKSRAPALRLVDHAAAGRRAGGGAVCARLVAAGGLKPLFTLLARTHDGRLLAHLVAVVASMLRLLPMDSAERIRTLAKLVERDYDKTARLVRLRRDYAARVGRAAADEVEMLSCRLDAGLATLQHVDASLAWLAAEDGGARRRIEQMLAERDEDLAGKVISLYKSYGGRDTGSWLRDTPYYCKFFGEKVILAYKSHGG